MNEINISEIIIEDRKRDYNQSKVDILSESIKEIGLLTPIILTEDNRLVAGLHRIEAMKLLGNEKIDFTVFKSVDELLIELAEIDENLIRNELEYLKKGKQLKRRKEIYIKLHPETKKGAVNQHSKNNPLNADSAVSKKESFVDNTKNATGESVRKIETTIQTACNIPDNLQDKIDGTPLAGKITVLQDIAKEVKNPEVQEELVNDIIAGEVKDVKEFKKKKRKEKTIETEKEAVKNKPETKNLFTITDNQKVIKCAAVITDPPYGILNEQWEPDDIKEFTVEWLSRWNDCGAEVFLSFFAQEYIFDGKQWFDETLTNYEFKQMLVWHYPNNIKPHDTTKFKYTWEPVFFYAKKGCKRKIENKNSEWGKELNNFDCLVGATPQSNFNDVNMKQHPAQKPIEVMRWLVNASTGHNELIADPFSGSGTTGVAATQLNRNFHGIEINKEYRELSKRRIATYGV